VLKDLQRLKNIPGIDTSSNSPVAALLAELDNFVNEEITIELNTNTEVEDNIGGESAEVDIGVAVAEGDVATDVNRTRT
jgi:hypothetical protein